MVKLITLMPFFIIASNLFIIFGLVEETLANRNNVAAPALDVRVDNAVDIVCTMARLSYVFFVKTTVFNGDGTDLMQEVRTMIQDLFSYHEAEEQQQLFSYNEAEEQQQQTLGIMKQILSYEQAFYRSRRQHLRQSLGENAYIQIQSLHWMMRTALEKKHGAGTCAEEWMCDRLAYLGVLSSAVKMAKEMIDAIPTKKSFFTNAKKLFISNNKMPLEETKALYSCMLLNSERLDTYNAKQFKDLLNYWVYRQLAKEYENLKGKIRADYEKMPEIDEYVKTVENAGAMVRINYAVYPGSKAN